MAMSQDHGNNLQTVQLLLKKNQVDMSYPALRQHHNSDITDSVFLIITYINHIYPNTEPPEGD